MRISFVINASDPATSAALREEVFALREAGHEVGVRLTFEGGDATDFAEAAARGGAELVIAAGGDGTVNEVVNGLQRWATDGDAKGRRLPRLGIVPIGTANDLANFVGIPSEIPDAVRVAVGGHVRPVDVGVVNGRHFVNVSTGGFGAEATQETGTDAKQALGPIAYLITGVRSFVTLEPSSACFRVEGETVLDGEFLLFAVGNSGRTGGGNQLTPEAKLDDGLLDLCIVRAMPRVDFLRLMPELRGGGHLDNPSVIYRQVRSLEIETAEPVSVNVDGEALNARTLSYSIAEHRIPLVVPG